MIKVLTVILVIILPLDSRATINPVKECLAEKVCIENPSSCGLHNKSRLDSETIILDENPPPNLVKNQLPNLCTMSDPFTDNIQIEETYYEYDETIESDGVIESKDY